jgi:hypothetical protein
MAFMVNSHVLFNCVERIICNFKKKINSKKRGEKYVKVLINAGRFHFKTS